MGSKQRRSVVRGATSGRGMSRRKVSDLREQERENAEASNVLGLMPPAWQLERTLEFWADRN